MNTDIEKLLRKAPGFTPPVGLKQRLIEQMPLEKKEIVSPPSGMKPGGWLRRWWPALAPAAVSVACAVVLTAQQGTIRELKASIQTLSQTPAIESTPVRSRAVTPVDTSPEMEQEINRLKELVERLKAEIGQLQQLQTENVKLHAQVAAPPELGLTPEETESLAKAKEKALSIACVNNLKQFGLAVRVWALDNNDSNPPNVLSMSNELSTPKILVCPADTNRPVAADWSSFTTANCSYEFLVPNEKDADKEPQRVLSRCPIHGHIGLIDGSVQSSVAKNHPDWLVERDGKTYMEDQPKQPPMDADERRVKAFVESYRTEPATAAFRVKLTDMQIKILQDRYGIVLTNQALPNQQP
jgi:hypothetical protein